MAIHSFLDWLALRDYDDALAHARIAIIKRIARGNVSLQNGNVLDDEALASLRDQGDRALARLIAQQAAVFQNGRDRGLQGIARHRS